MLKVQRLLSKKQVRDIISLSYAEIDRKVKSKKFPAPLRLSEKTRGRIAWLEEEVADWVNARLAERADRSR